MSPRFRFSEITTWLVMLAGLGWLLGWAYVGAASHEPERTPVPAPQLCPSADECWKTCFHASVIALESCIEHADAVRATSATGSSKTTTRITAAR